MKSLNLLLSLLALAAFAAAPALRAQDAPAPAKGEHHRGGGELAMLTKRLSLTADQQAKIGPIVQDQQKALEALKADTTVVGKAKVKQMRTIRESHKAQIMAILTPDQQAKFKDAGKGMKKGGKKHGSNSDAPAASTPSPAPAN